MLIYKCKFIFSEHLLMVKSIIKEKCMFINMRLFILVDLRKRKTRNKKQEKRTIFHLKPIYLGT